MAVRTLFRPLLNQKLLNKFLLSIVICSFVWQCSGSNYDNYDYNPPRRYRSTSQQPAYPQYQAPYAPMPYAVPQNQYYPPNSRAYSNPYDFQQPSYGGRPPAYPDYEQYYVPPAQYINREQPFPGSSSDDVR